jgi:hypothetical protein
LRDLGLVEGRNVIIERRTAEGQQERRVEVMQEVIALDVDVIVTGGPVRASRSAPPPVSRSSRWSTMRWTPGSSRAWHGPAATSPATAATFRE